ncbi:MAG TPA: hypothetical protein VLY63_21380 [Anaerolineae bacterium]|nr:hypothetical protein [Anaerolineae bacterium]
MSKHKQFPECEGMEYYFAEDGRLVAMVVRSDFESYGLFPPFLDTEEERAFVQTAYDINLDRERDTKAHVTPEDFPLQITLLNRDPGSVVKPHYHEVFGMPEGKYRHQLMLTLRGRVRIGVYTVDNEHLTNVFLDPGDLILMTEGHQVEFLEPNTKVIEIKQGPIPAEIADEMVVLGS